MNLKLVVASMSVLGLVSCPVLAATQTEDTYQKPVHHQKVKKHHVRHVVRHHEYQDYKDAQPIAMQAPVDVCTLPTEALTMVSMTQNRGRAVPNPCSPDWYRRIMLAGGINVDFGKWGNRNANYMGENYRRISLNDAYLNIAASVNEWAHAFASISYNSATINDPTLSTATVHYAEYDAAYSNNVRGDVHQALQLEQAFATFGNFQVSPFFIQVGKQFEPFGRYKIHPITEPMTQVMSKTLATSLNAGFIANGFNGSVWVFDDPLPRIGGSSQPTNYGASLGYDYPCETFGFSVGVSYLYNLIGVNDTAYKVNQYNLNNSTLTVDPGLDGLEGYHSRKAGVAAWLDVNTGPFLLAARYVTALNRFSVLDLPENALVDINPATGAPIAGAQGAEPWSASLRVGMGFDHFMGIGMGGENNIFVGYETSRQAAALEIPRQRWVLGANVEPCKGTILGFEWDNDHGYSHSNGGNGETTNLVSLRVGVRFA